MSKRKLIAACKENYVDDWDDPRMPTISGFRRRGYTSEAIRNFAESVRRCKTGMLLEDIALLEFAIREDLNKKVQRAMAVIHPLKW